MHTYIAYLICKLFFQQHEVFDRNKTDVLWRLAATFFSTTDNQGATSHLQLQCHAVCVINLELIRDVSVTESVFYLFVCFFPQQRSAALANAKPV